MLDSFFISLSNNLLSFDTANLDNLFQSLESYISLYSWEK